jgi:hypothetical protein
LNYGARLIKEKTEKRDKTERMDEVKPGAEREETD